MLNLFQCIAHSITDTNSSDDPQLIIDHERNLETCDESICNGSNILENFNRINFDEFNNLGNISSDNNQPSIQTATIPKSKLHHSIEPSTTSDFVEEQVILKPVQKEYNSNSKSALNEIS